MAKEVFKDALLKIDVLGAFGGTELELSDTNELMESVELDYGAESQDGTGHGATTRTVVGGTLKNWTITVNGFQDEVAVNDVLFGIIGEVVDIEFRPNNVAQAATAPKYTGKGHLGDYKMYAGGTVGEIKKFELTINAAGSLTRAT